MVFYGIYVERGSGASPGSGNPSVQDLYILQYP
jgi:hypothetical protein